MVTAKSTRSAFWFVRVDGPESFLRQKCEALASQIGVKAMLAAYHEGDRKENPHCHFVIEIDSNPQKQTFALRIKSLFEITNKNNYSLEVWDGKRGAGACSYLFHEENPSILVNRGFTEQDILEATTANAAVQRVVRMNREKASTRLPDQAVAHFENLRVNSEVLRHDIMVFMLKRIKSGENHHPGSYLLKKYVEEVELRLLDANEIEEYAAHLINNLWR